MDDKILSKQMRSLYGDDMVHCALCVNKDCEHRDELDGGCYAGREHSDYEIYLWYAWEFGKWSLVKVVKTKKEILTFLKNKKYATYAVAKDGVVIMEHTCKTRNGMSVPQMPVKYSTLKKAKIYAGK